MRYSFLQFDPLFSLSLSDGPDPDAPVAGGAGPSHRVHERRLPQVLCYKQGRQVYMQTNY
jgi:hypothetical protein